MNDSSERQGAMTDPVQFTQLGNEQVMFVLVKTTWAAAGKAPSLHFQIIATPRETDLDDLRQAIQDDFETHAQEDHHGSTMTVEVYDADHVPDGVMPDDAVVTSSPEASALAEAIGTHQDISSNPERES